MTTSRLEIRQQKKKYFKKLKQTGLLGVSRKAAGIGRRRLEGWREDEAFCEKEVQAQMDHLEKREKQVDSRAFDGVREDIFFNGEKIGHRRKFSDNLAMFRLKALAPDKYADRSSVDHQHSGSVTVYLPDNGREAKQINQTPDRGVEE